jgi:hypothetical protein
MGTMFLSSAFPKGGLIMESLGIDLGDIIEIILIIIVIIIIIVRGPRPL